MQILPEDLAEFKKIYAKDYGITLTDEQALEMATSLVTLMSIICRPLPTETCEPAENKVT